MSKRNADNERIKRKYLIYLKEARQQSDATVDAVAAALARFEADTKYRDFKLFRPELAMAFKKRLSEQDSRTTGDKLSKATLNATMANLKRFFQWLSREPGYTSRIHYSDADYFNLSEKEVRVATARREKPAPSLEEVKHVIAQMPTGSEIERRNRAVVAFALATGARDSAIASMRLKHVDLEAGCVYQDAREVDTKFSKTFTTFLFPVSGEVLAIVRDWVRYLREDKMWGGDDPLFPATKIAPGTSHQFEVVGLKRETWSNATPIRTIFREAFKGAGLRYYNPHTIRNTLAVLGGRVCSSPEEYKAWSQNLGHSGVLTTFISYGTVATGRQGELIRRLGQAKPDVSPQIEEAVKAILNQLSIGGTATGTR